ncbi:hypothetical protein ACGE24_06660 [Corynebacterium kroppenstedtii]|uniref:hypothetical protein n=1 Tax=Corynebacterium sp. PCR 32 TaxID=3351342 RepID=UPI003098898D
MSDTRDYNDSPSVDFSALHEDSRTEVIRRPLSEDQPEPTEDVLEPRSEREPLLSRGLGRAIGAAAVMVGVSALIVAGASVYYVTHKSDNEHQLAAVPVDAGINGTGASVKAIPRSTTPRPTTSGAPSASGRGPASSGGSASAAHIQGKKGGSELAPGDTRDVRHIEGNTGQPAGDDKHGEPAGPQQPTGPEWVDGVLVLRMAEPTVEDFAAQFTYLIDPHTPDAGIKANLDAGPISPIIGRFLQKDVQMNQANNWEWSFRGPVKIDGDFATVHFVDHANGYPEKDRELVFKKVDGNWKYSRATACSYMQVMGQADKCKG